MGNSKIPPPSIFKHINLWQEIKENQNVRVTQNDSLLNVGMSL